MDDPSCERNNVVSVRIGTTISCDETLRNLKNGSVVLVNAAYGRELGSKASTGESIRMNDGNYHKVDGRWKRDCGTVTFSDYEMACQCPILIKTYVPRPVEVGDIVDGEIAVKAPFGTVLADTDNASQGMLAFDIFVRQRPGWNKITEGMVVTVKPHRERTYKVLQLMNTWET